MRSRRAGRQVTALVAVALLAGCTSPDPAAWNQVDEDRRDQLTADPWVAGNQEAIGPSQDWLWERPNAERRSPRPETAAWQGAAAEVADAEAAGWSVAFVRCVGPDAEHLVDLWRELDDGAPATARLSVGRLGVSVAAVAPHHLEENTVVRPADVDPEVCLDPSGDPLQTRWSGVPVMLLTHSGPASAGW